MPRTPLRPKPGDTLLTDDEARSRLGLSLTQVRRLRRAGDLTSVRIGRAVRVTASSVDAFIARSAVTR